MTKRSVALKNCYRFPTRLGLITGMVLLMICCNSEQEKSATVKNAGLDTKDSLVIELEGVDSVTVFDLLKEKHRVEYKSSLQGVFVTAIDSVKGGDGYFWVYTVNGNPAQTACDRYITKNGDKIEWLFRKR
jgi:hypothetical protein